jgi:acyl transferase domain-containing protein
MPAAVVGHSSGEIAAAYAAGLLSLEEAITVAYHYGQAAKKTGSDGAMAAVSLGVADVSEFLRPGVVIACENSPSSTTISGDSDALDEMLVAVKAEKPDVSVRKIKVDVAYHSRRCSNIGWEGEWLTCLV